MALLGTNELMIFLGHQDFMTNELKHWKYLKVIDVMVILLSTLTSVANDLFNYALRLDNELSGRPPRGRHGLWTGLKTQMGCLQIVWWNQ